MKSTRVPPAPRHQAAHGVQRGLLLASFLSGMAGLIYELLWVREFSLVAGSTQAALTCVLSVFFLGLALGNLISGRLAARLRRPLLLYLVAEIGIAGWALLFHPLLAGWKGLYASLYASLPLGSAWVHVLRLGGSAFLVLVPTTLMGATLPLLAQNGGRDLPGTSRWLALLYGLNTVGAVLGIVGTGFFLIEHLGVSVPLRLAALLNLGAAACVVPALRRQGRVEGAGAPADRVVPERFSREALLLLISFGVLGFANIAAEVLWTAYYALIYPNDTYIFSTILLVYLLGVGAGSLLGARFFARARHPLRLLGLLQLVSATGTIVLFYTVPPIVMGLAPQTRDFGQQLGHYLQGVIVGILPPTLCMGASFSVLVRAVLTRERQAGRVAGAALAWNTVGGVFGALVGGFLWLDRLGVQTGLLLTAGLTAAVGLTLCLVRSENRRAGWTALAILGAPVLLALTVRPPGLPESLLAMHFPEWAQMRVLETRPSVHGTVAITEERGDIRKVWINSGWVASERAHLAFGYAPWLLHPGPVHSALGICCGTGRTFGALLNAGVQDLDLVDINRSVITLSSKWLARSNHGVLTDPRARVIIDDGRNFVRYGTKRYDLITLEPLQMYQKGVVSFYTREFYEEARRRMAAGGVLCQWVPLNLLGRHEFVSMVRTFLQVFPQALLWGRRGHSLVLLGYNTDSPLAPFDPGEVAARIADPALQDDLSQEEMLGRYDPFVYTLVDGAGLAAMSQEGEIYTDDRPTLEFTAPRGEYAPDRNIGLVIRYLVPLDRICPFPDERTQREAERLRLLTLQMYAPGTDNASTRQAIEETRRRLYATAP